MQSPAEREPRWTFTDRESKAHSPDAIDLTGEIPTWTDLALGDGGACVTTEGRVERSGSMRPGGSHAPRWDGFGVRGRSLRGLDVHLSSVCLETDGEPICWGGERLPLRPIGRAIVPTPARAQWRLRRGERPLRARVTPVACVEDVPYDERAPRLDATARAGGRLRVAMQLVGNCGHAPIFDARRLAGGTIEIGRGDLPAARRSLTAAASTSSCSGSTGRTRVHVPAR